MVNEIDPVDIFLPVNETNLFSAPFLEKLADQAQLADETRTVSSTAIEAIRGTDFMRMAASTNLGGTEQSVLQMGRELEAIASRCPSTAWALWNHLCVFHLFVGTLGPDHISLLK